MRIYDNRGRLILPAKDVRYDNAISGLTATQVQAAIDELAAGSGGAAPSTRGATFVSGSALSVPVNDVPVRIPIACTITKVTVLTLGGTGSCVVDIWKDTYAAYPPVVADSICAAAKPTISSGIKYEDSTLTGWTTAVAAGDVLMFHLESTSTFTVIAISLEFSP